MKRMNQIFTLLCLFITLLTPVAFADSADSADNTPAIIDLTGMQPFESDYSGVYFFYPLHWTEETINPVQTSNFSQYVFCYRTAQHTTVFQYIVQEYYNNFYLVEHPNTTNTVLEVDAEMNTIDNLSSLLNIPELFISEVEYGDTTYLRYDQIGHGDQYFVFKNGYLHMFQFSDGPGTSEFTNFERTMKTVKYLPME